VNCDFCDIPSAIKHVWSEHELLNYHIPATEGADNAFFNEGFAITEAPLPYVVFKPGPPLGETSLGPGAILDLRPYQLKIYGASRQLLTELSVAARTQYFNAGCLDTCEGSVCKIKIDAGNQVLFGDGTRMILHQMNLMVVSKYELSD